MGLTGTTTIAAIRFGTGLPEPDRAPVGPAEMIARLAGRDVAARRWPGQTLDDMLPDYRAALGARRRAREGGALQQEFRARLKVLNRRVLQSRRVMLARALSSPDPFRERLVAFWADHFTTVARARIDRPLPVAMIEDAIRPHVAGPFAAMLTAATLHPAMLVYLDQARSVGPGSPAAARKGAGLNENLGRELLELHTLGVGAVYGQDDVRQMAELLTGLRVDTERRTAFDPDAAEPGPETVLGRTYDGEGTAPILSALQDLSLHPETARHVCGKIAVHFVADAPDPGIVAAMRSAWAATGGDLAAVCGAMLEHPAAWSGPLAKARQPWDFLVAAFRALGLSADDVLRVGDGRFNRMVQVPLRAMGQPLQEAPGPDGWPEAAEAWITAPRLAARITWAMTMPQRLVDDLPDPVALADRALGPLADDTLRLAVSRAENRREGVGLVLASPAFNRR